MKVRTFIIRLEDEKMAEDEKKLNEFLDSNSVEQMFTQFVDAKNKYWTVLIFYKSQIKKASNSKVKFYFDNINDLNEYEKHIYQKLIDWRKAKADERNLPKFLVCSNSDFISIIKYRPKTRDELYNIRGFGQNKIEKFGQELVELVNSYT